MEKVLKCSPEHIMQGLTPGEYKYTPSLLCFSTYSLVHAVLMLFTRIINLRFFSVSVSYITDFCSSKLTLYIDIKFTYTVNKGLLRRKSYKQVYVFSAQMVFSLH